MTVEEADKRAEAESTHERAYPDDSAEHKRDKGAYGIGEYTTPEVGHFFQFLTQHQRQRVIRRDAEVGRLVHGAGKAQHQHAAQHDEKPRKKLSRQCEASGDEPHKRRRDGAHAEPVDKGADADKPSAEEELGHEPQAVHYKQHRRKAKPHRVPDRHDHRAAGVIAHERQLEQCYAERQQNYSRRHDKKSSKRNFTEELFHFPKHLSPPYRSKRHYTISYTIFQ